MASHEIVHVEFAANDTQAAGAFYQDLFGWTAQRMPGPPEMDYVMVETGGSLGGGIAKAEAPMYKPGDVIFYVSTPDIEASLAKVVQLGGQQVLGKTPIPGMGHFALFLDPQGTRVGLFTPAM